LDLTDIEFPGAGLLELFEMPLVLLSSELPRGC